MSKKDKKVIEDEARQEIEFLTERLHDIHVFLQKWKFYIGDRDEAADTAFIAVTELEMDMRERREYLAHAITEEIVPF